MDKERNIVAKEDAFGCKVTHNITHHDHVIVLDEVGGNTSQKGDGHISGELMVRETRKAPHRKINTKRKYYTCLGLCQRVV